MADVSIETVAGKLNRVGYDAFIQALRVAKTSGNRNVELAHWLMPVLANEKSDISTTLLALKKDPAKALADVTNVVEGFRRNETEMPGISNHIIDLFDRGWHYATLMFGEAHIRTGHTLVAALKSGELRRALSQLSSEISGLDPEMIAAEARTLWRDSDEETLMPMDGSSFGASSSAAAGGEAQAKGTTALDRFTLDMTEQAESGSMDAIVGRDDEIRQIIDVLLRRRQNNPILTGEAGVGKTAVVEGFAQRLASGDVPPQLKGVRLRALDIGLMQAGASMKGEFEQRLRSVIDEVQASPVPIIMFIDEAHTLVGAGGAQGTGDAANLLKPALARGTLRTIGATTWSEYRQYFEKDPALTRRFQPVEIEEPSLEKACFMLRGILDPMENHHGVRISDQAVVAAVGWSARYIPARQLPDKAVSLLDTACARVAISQTTIPAPVADLAVAIDRLERELDAKQRQRDLGVHEDKRIGEVESELEELRAQYQERNTAYLHERAIVDEVTALREKIAALRDGVTAPVPETAAPVVTADDEEQQGVDETAALTGTTDEDPAELAEELAARSADLEQIDADQRMVHAYVDEQAVGAVLSDWTGIPMGRMVKDEIQTIITLPETLKQRVIGQDHGLEQIARRIETNRAKLDNPDKPIGVFMLCGPSGVGKTESALALAEALYGGDQNMITINMSEFQEAHTVSLLKGAPPGYVGFGEGGRLTEAVRRKPYSVVLLDEMEKAHPDVHELFFQVFDKGLMEDGNGRAIDFKNTLIILTSNVGTDVIMDMADKGETRPSTDELSTALRPALTQVFPPALLGRIVTIPYFPLSGEMLGKIIRLQLNRIVRRVRENHDAEMTFTDAVVDHIAARCNDPDAGGRMIDNIITNSLLPQLSRKVLNHQIEQKSFDTIVIDEDGGEFSYELSCSTQPQ